MTLKRIVSLSVFFIFMISELYAQESIISKGDLWLYNDHKHVLPTNWYNDKNASPNWKEGPSPLGYGDTEIKTVIGFGDNPKKKDITKYFKKVFIVNDPYKHLIYKLNVQRDDGVVIYLNGKEIMRNNMPNGTITDSTRANDLIFNSYNENLKHSKLISPDDLVSGTNIISASVHQAREDSSDCIFNLELEGSSNHEIIPLLLKEQTIKNLTLDLKLRELNYAQEVAKKDSQIELIEGSRNNMQLFLTIIGFIFLTTLAFLLYKWREFTSKEKSLLKSITDLKEINEDKNREMMNISLSSLNDKQYLKGIKKSLEESLESTDKNNLVYAAKSVINNINYNSSSSEDWENLRKHFNAVHSGYIDKLKKLHPSLTDVEIRHCIFIRLHMQTKEIANTLHIDPKSVQVSRYRLKKKMNLGEEINLKEYLLSL